MITHEEAIRIVEDSALPLPLERVSLRESVGRILAEDVFSDMDMPPFDKSAVDGYACRRQDLQMELKVVEVIPAGKQPGLTITSGTCSKLMTGGMVPEGADTVIMVEDVEEIGQGMIRFTGNSTASNIAYCAEDIRKGEKVLEKGTKIRPQHIAVMASVGYTEPLVAVKPAVGIISTGDELVEPGIKPSIAQIRNSNSWQLLAQAEDMGCKATYYGIARDTGEEIFHKISDSIRANDITILTGGVSVGDFDFVPQIIEQAGFQIRFRTMAVQPGKPAIFAAQGGKYIFGLPGNPVSAFVQFIFLGGALIRKITGSLEKPTIIRLPLGRNFRRKKANRKSLVPVRIADDGKVYPIEYHGSAHIHSYVHAMGVMAYETGQYELLKDSYADVRLL